MAQQQDERTDPLWAIPMGIFVAGFFAAMVYYASLGSNVPESYTSVMITGFLAFIGFLMLLDVISRRRWRWQSPTIIVGTLAAVNCFIMLPFVKTFIGGYSFGFMFASLGVTVFLAVFFYVAFFTSTNSGVSKPVSTEARPPYVSFLSLLW